MGCTTPTDWHITYEHTTPSTWVPVGYYQQQFCIQHEHHITTVLRSLTRGQLTFGCHKYAQIKSQFTQNVIDFITSYDQGHSQKFISGEGRWGWGEEGVFSRQFVPCHVSPISMPQSGLSHTVNRSLLAASARQNWYLQASFRRRLRTFFFQQSYLDLVIWLYIWHYICPWSDFSYLNHSKSYWTELDQTRPPDF